MSEAEKYEGYKWIAVKRGFPVELNGVNFVYEDHHIAETSFLIDKVRELAKVIDTLRANVAYYQNLAEVSQQQVSRQSRWDQDYLPYHEDEYDR